jgi:flagellar motility protein MotE (MotC chaperone)
MNRVRLLPIVIVAASGLLVLKATELVSSGEALFAQPEPQPKATTAEELPKFARALVRHRVPDAREQDFTGSVQGRREKKDEARAEPGRAEPGRMEVAQKAPEPRGPELPPASTSERAVLERLQERRGAIDDRARELEMRETLLQAAERKLDSRINDLKEIEGRLDAGAKAEQAEADKQIRTVVVMYESMKAKDAARVFDRLKLDVLVPIATSMKPARMAEIMAAMSPEAAERLTVALASRSAEARTAQSAPSLAAAPPGELPRLDLGPNGLRR